MESDDCCLYQNLNQPYKKLNERRQIFKDPNKRKQKQIQIVPTVIWKTYRRPRIILILKALRRNVELDRPGVNLLLRAETERWAKEEKVQTCRLLESFEVAFWKCYEQIQLRYQLW